jgi:hypothetical protein
MFIASWLFRGLEVRVAEEDNLGVALVIYNRYKFALNYDQMVSRYDKGLPLLIYPSDLGRARTRADDA